MMSSASTALDTGTPELLAELDQGVAIVTLNRPESRNALSDTLSPALRSLFLELASHDEVRCLLLTAQRSP